MIPLLLPLLSRFSRVRSVWPHRRQPTRLPRPWDSPGKNTGVGCHFLLQGVKVKSESEVPKSCPTLSDPMDRSLPGSPIPGIFQARVLEWGAIAVSDASTSGGARVWSLPRKLRCMQPKNEKGFPYWPTHFSCHVGSFLFYCDLLKVNSQYKWRLEETWIHILFFFLFLCL